MNRKNEEERCLEIINSMNVIETDCDCGEMLYALVENNKNNRSILYQIGLTDKDIEKECYPDEGILDISSIAFKYADCYYKGKFMLNEHLPKGVEINE